MNIIQDELNKLSIAYDGITFLQDKDGVIVARIACGEKSYVIKCFQKEDYKRELKNYQLLASLGIPTIRVIAFTDSALLLEDIDCSSTYRLGIMEDISDSDVARRIAVWYKQLHAQGYGYVCQHGESMYDEADFFTLENIVYIKEKTGTQNAPAWAVLEKNYAVINEILRNTRRTITYNDFYYTNMVIAKDMSSALMFDYNLLGKGYAYADIRNVLSSLSEESGKAFLEEYGEFDPLEKTIDDVVSVVVTLFFACRRDKFPRWAQVLIDELDTTFIEKIRILMGTNTIIH